MQSTSKYLGIISSPGNACRITFAWFPRPPLGTTHSQWFVDPGQIKLYDNSSEPGKNMMNITFICEFDSTTNLAPGPGGFEVEESIGTDPTKKMYFTNAYASDENKITEIKDYNEDLSDLDNGPNWFPSLRTYISNGDVTVGGSVLTVTPSPGWSVNEFQYKYLNIRSGLNEGEYFISSNTADTLTISTTFPVSDNDVVADIHLSPLSGGTLQIISDTNNTNQGLYRYITRNDSFSIFLQGNPLLINTNPGEFINTGYVDLENFVTIPEYDESGMQTFIASVTGNTLTATPSPGWLTTADGAEYTGGVYKNRYLNIRSGPNIGRYLISGNTDDTITISTTFPVNENDVNADINLVEIYAGSVALGGSVLTDAAQGWIPNMFNDQILYISSAGDNEGYYKIVSNTTNTITIDPLQFNGAFQATQSNLKGKVYITQTYKYSNYRLLENYLDPSYNSNPLLNKKLNYPDIQTQLQSGQFRLETYMHAWPSLASGNYGSLKVDPSIPHNVIHRFEIIPYWLIRSELDQNSIIPTWRFICKCIVREIDRLDAHFINYWLDDKVY